MKKKERNIRDSLGKCQEQNYRTTDVVGKVKIDRSVWKHHSGLNITLYVKTLSGRKRKRWQCHFENILTSSEWVTGVRLYSSKVRRLICG
jgi:hypothetical protein